LLIIKINWMTKWFERLFRLFPGTSERDLSIIALKRSLAIIVIERAQHVEAQTT